MATPPPFVLFPNLQRLSGVLDHPSFYPLLVHNSVTELNIHFDTFISFSEISPRITQGMPNISRLTLRAYCYASRIELPLRNFFHGMMQLEVVILPLYYLIDSVMAVLSGIPCLREIRVNHDEGSFFHGSPNDVKTLQPALIAGSFSSLHHLEFATTISQARGLITHPNFPADSLTSLWFRGIDSANEDTPERLRELLLALDESCKNLKRVDLVLSSLDGFDEEEVDTWPSLTLDDLAPILCHRGLKSFGFRHPHSIVITEEEELESISRHWTNMERLDLNP